MSTTGSRIEEVSGTEDNSSSSSPFTQEALNNDIVLEKIISDLGENPIDLLNYRSVCHKWNNAIVKKINKSCISFPILLRYEPDAQQRWTRNILQSVTNTLSGTAAKIRFDTVVVDSDFYLDEAKLEWKRFLEIHGETIRHFKFKIRPWKSPTSMFCGIVFETRLSMENLRAVFFQTPNLESLEFCVRFPQFEPGTTTSDRQPLFLGTEVPQLQKLAKITIQEPHKLSYTLGFLQEILSMAPNLKSLYIEPSRNLTTFCRAIKSQENQIRQSLTSIGFSGAHFLGDAFHYLRLTTLEINNLFGHESGKYVFVNQILRIHRSTLVTVILGNRRNNETWRIHPPTHAGIIHPMNSSRLTFPPIMENLKSLEVDLTKFELPHVYSYKINFPVLESLTFRIGRNRQSCHVVESSVPVLFGRRPLDGPSLTLREFFVFGRPGIRQKELISRYARQTFPIADHHIGG